MFEVLVILDGYEARAHGSTMETMKSLTTIPVNDSEQYIPSLFYEIQISFAWKSQWRSRQYTSLLARSCGLDRPRQSKSCQFTDIHDSRRR